MRLKVKTALLAAALFAAFLGAGLSARQIILSPVDSVNDIVYAKTSDGPVRLDVTWPTEGGPYPVIIYFHGGGWAIGDKAAFRPRMKMLAQNSYVVFNANYRLSTDAQFPAAVNDVMGAIIYAKEHAKDYNGDPERVAVMGDSAGAHLAALAAYAHGDPYYQPSYRGKSGADCSVQAAVLMYGGYRLEWVYEEKPRLWNLVETLPMVVAFMGGTPESKPIEYLKGSPASYLDRPGLPPTFILCGTSDSVITESEWLYQNLRQREVPVEALFVTGAMHEFNYLDARKDFPCFRAILDFLDRHLSNSIPIQPE